MENVSTHESIREMYEVIKSDELTNSFDRFDAQGNRCTFCSEGISCQLCSNGPCRITSKADRGVCGIDADGMAMRFMLFRNSMGTLTYTFHAKEAVKTLKATAQGKTPFKISDEAKLFALAEQLEISTTGKSGILGKEKPLSTNEVAEKVADALLAEIKKDSDEESKLVNIFAPKSRTELWKKLGILPGGPLEESMDSISSCLTNVDGDYVSLAKKALRLGVSCAYGAQIPIEWSQDILFGTPSPHVVDTDLGIIDPGYVNIAANGHEPFIGVALIQAAKKPENQEKAKAAGAKGLHIIGSIETGQELIQRFEVDDVFVGLTGNWLTIEPALATGGIDVFAMDMNCSPPAIGQYQDKYNTTLVSVSKLIGVPGTKKQIIYKPDKVEAQAQELIDLAIENFKSRKDKTSHPVEKKQKAVAGISIEACLSVLGGSLDPLLDVIKNGTIKGVVALVSCSTLKDSPQDSTTVAVTKELIKRDILVLSAGCGNAAVQVAGLTTPEAKDMAGDGLKAVCEQLSIPPVLSFGTCTDTGRILVLVKAVADALGVDTAQLPIAVTAPEYMEQKATIDALAALAFGLYTHVAPVAPVTGAPNLVKLLTDDIEGLTGGKLAVQTDPVEAVDGIEAHINSKRQALGI